MYFFFCLTEGWGWGGQESSKKQNTCKEESLKNSKQLERSKWDMSTKEEQGLIANTAACESHAAALASVQRLHWEEPLPPSPPDGQNQFP